MYDKRTNDVALQAMDMTELEKLLSDVLHEMRRRDSQHMSGDVITKSQSLRILRSTNKLSQ